MRFSERGFGQRGLVKSYCAMTSALFPPCRKKILLVVLQSVFTGGEVSICLFVDA